MLDGDFTERFASGEHAYDRGTLVVKPDAAHSDAFGGAGARCLIIEVEPWRYRALREHAPALDDLVVERGGRFAGLAESVSRELAAPAAIIEAIFSPLFVANLLTGYVYRRSGILAAFTLRLTFYAVWHVGYRSLR